MDQEFFSSWGRGWQEFSLIHQEIYNGVRSMFIQVSFHFYREIFFDQQEKLTKKSLPDWEVSVLCFGHQDHFCQDQDILFYEGGGKFDNAKFCQIHNLSWSLGDSSWWDQEILSFWEGGCTHTNKFLLIAVISSLRDLSVSPGGIDETENSFLGWGEDDSC